jgi:ABC-type multidrug transport system ATPase subunit
MSLEPSKTALSFGNDESGSVEDDGDKSSNGLLLRWSRVRKTVLVQKTYDSRISFGAPTIAASNDAKKGNSKKVILSDVSGFARPGEVLAMMGPSGSGKTSLLNCLSGRSPYESGVLSINGKPLDQYNMKRLMAKIAYVKQTDIFFEHLTVYDQLAYTASLRLPQTWSKEKKMAEVDRTIELLRLSKVADSEIRMLSGGEKKRVNIGTELLTDPDIVLLDEPTSGLDSTTSVELVKMLQQLAQEAQKTVIMSIHQPSSALFQSFDRVLYLAGGNAVYFGKPKDSLLYLKEHDMPCPDGYNAADHWMDLLVKDASVQPPILTDTENLTDNEDGLSSYTYARSTSMTTRQRLIHDWDNEAIAKELDASVNEESEKSTTGKNNKEYSKYNTSWGFQYKILVHRSLKNSRSAIFTPMNIIKSVLIGLVAGLLYFQMDYTESSIQDRASYFFFTMTYWVMDSMFQSFMTFPTERDVVLKERASGSYRLSAYFLAKTTSELPARLILPCVYMVISFWMASISNSFSIFLATVGITLLSVMTGEAIGLLVGSTVYDMEKGQTVLTVVALFLALLGGFFVQNVPSWLSWAQYLSPFAYAFFAILPIVFNEPIPCDGSDIIPECGGSDTGSISPEVVLNMLTVKNSVAFNVGMLFFFALFPRFIAYFALRAKKEGDR